MYPCALHMHILYLVGVYKMLSQALESKFLEDEFPKYSEFFSSNLRGEFSELLIYIQCVQSTGIILSLQLASAETDAERPCVVSFYLQTVSESKTFHFVEKLNCIDINKKNILLYLYLTSFLSNISCIAGEVVRSNRAFALYTDDWGPIPGIPWDPSNPARSEA